MATRAVDIDLATEPLAGDALHALMHRARDEGPVVPATFLGAPAFLLAGHRVVRDYLSDHERFPGGALYAHATRPHIGRTFIDMDGAEHDTYRRLVTPAFRSRAVTRFVEDGLPPLVTEVLDRIAARGEADLAVELAQVLPFWAISRKLGLPRGSEEQQRAWALALLSYPMDPSGALAASAQVTDFLAPTLAQRRSEPAQDVISHLLDAEHRGVRLTDDDVASHVRLLYAVGAATTSDAMSTVLHRVLTEPGLIDRARAEPDLIPHIVAESLRMEPAVATLPRIAPAGGTIANVDLPRGALVLCGLAAANRDPEVFADPDRFDPTRPDGDLLSFGLGQKYCPGAHLARRQLSAALAAMLHRLPDLTLVEATDPTSAVLRRVEHLRVTWATNRP